MRRSTIRQLQRWSSAGFALGTVLSASAQVTPQKPSDAVALEKAMMAGRDQLAPSDKSRDILRLTTNQVPSWYAVPGGTGLRGGCVTCQPGDTLENEPDCGLPVDTINGGCNSIPIVSQPIVCDQTYCGSFAFDGATRDTDWFDFTVPGAAGTQVDVTLVANAEAPYVFGFTPTSCTGVFDTFFVGDTCLEGSVTKCVPAGTTVYIVILPQFLNTITCGDTVNGDWRMTVTCAPGFCPPPANDLCDDALLLNCGETVFGSNSQSNTDGLHSCGAAAFDVWYKWVAESGSATLTTCGSAMDTVLSVYDACGGAEIACLDDFCGLQTQLTVSGLTVGSTYYVSVSGFSGQIGDFNLTLTDCGPTGACCTGASCVVTSPSACQSSGGVYQGNGSDCGQVSYVASRAGAAIEDISGTGTPGCAADDCTTPVAIGFTFDYFGVPQNNIDVGSNGHMRFGGGAFVFGNPASFPTADGYDNIIGPYWDDWRTDSGGTLYTETRGSAPNRRFIAQWVNVTHFSGPQIANFQAILYESSGNIEFRYGNPLDQNSPVVGVENADGSVGTNVVPLPVSGESILLTRQSTSNPCSEGCPEPGCSDPGADCDFDGNCRVDLADLAILLTHFGANSGQTNATGDTDGDGDVQLDDLARVLTRFGNVCD